MNINLSIDDFGTDYSALGDFQKYVFSTLKIDPSFISQLERSHHSAKLTKVMIAMSHSLQMEVVAEGVENTVQRDFFKQLDCELMEGYLFGEPLPLYQLPKQLKISLKYNDVL